MSRFFIDFRQHQQKQRLYEELKKLNGRYEIQITRESDGQFLYRYYSAVLVATVSRYTGHTPEEVDKIIRRKFLSWEAPDPDTGKAARYVPTSIAYVPHSEMSWFTSMVRAWVYEEFNIEVLSPEDITV